MSLNVSQLIKLLYLTSSENDNEALLALRMVNSRLKAANLTWEKIISSKLQQKNQYESNSDKIPEFPEEFDFDFFNQMIDNKSFLRYVSENEKGWTLFQGIATYGLTEESLSVKQWAVLKNMWNSFRRKHA